MLSQFLPVFPVRRRSAPRRSSKLIQQTTPMTITSACEIYRVHPKVWRKAG